VRHACREPTLAVSWIQACAVRPPAFDDWLPEAHEVRFIAEAFGELLDVSSI